MAKKAYLWACIERHTKNVMATFDSRDDARLCRMSNESVKRVRKHGKGYRVIGRG